jgi:phosphate-selective porin OprO/OprP
MTTPALVALLSLSLVGLTAAQDRPPANPQTPTPATPPEGWKVEPFSISNKAARFHVALKGYVQADFRSFLDWQVGDGSDDTLRSDDAEWRRTRIGVEGAWRKLAFEIDVDPAFAEGDMLKDAWLGLRVSKQLAIDGGHMKLPVSPEWLTSPAKTDFIERAVAVDSLAPGRDWGGLLHGELGRVLEYSAGVFEGDSRSSSARAETTGAARIVLKPARWLHLGSSFSQGDVVADPVGPGTDPSRKGVEGTSGTGYKFFHGVYVNGRRRRWGADARVQGGPVSVWGEFLETREERKGQGPTLEDLPDAYGRGWSATATWLVTGERKTRTIRPGRGLFAGPGAVELAVRYEELWFDDVSDEGFESAGSRAGNIRPAGIRTFTGGLSWWPTTFLRFQGNVLLERYDDPLRAPEPGNAGDYVSLLGRVQVHLP